MLGEIRGNSNINYMKLRHGSLFSGGGGFDLAAEKAGWENVFHCEWNPFCTRILKHYWPRASSYSDIRTFNAKEYYGKIDVLSGGFPCQPFSAAGKRKGTEDERYLWPEMLRVIRECSPNWVVGENVYGIVDWNEGLVFEQVHLDLEKEGYEVQAFVLPAAGVEAPHRRYRVWFVGRKRNTSECNAEYSTSGNDTNESRCAKVATPKAIKVPTEFTTRTSHKTWANWPTQPPFYSGDDGFSSRLDGVTFPKWRNESIKLFGNAIVPQLGYEIFSVINFIEWLNRD